MTATGYDDRMLVIEVIGLNQPNSVSTSYTVKVPYRSLARTLQFINRRGGKVVRVTALSATAAIAELPQVPSVVDRVSASPAAIKPAAAPESVPNVEKDVEKDVEKPAASPPAALSAEAESESPHGEATPTAEPPSWLQRVKLVMEKLNLA